MPKIDSDLYGVLEDYFGPTPSSDKEIGEPNAFIVFDRQAHQLRIYPRAGGMMSVDEVDIGADIAVWPD